MIQLVWENRQSGEAWTEKEIKIAEKCISETLKLEQFEYPVEISLLLVNNEQMRTMNQETRNIDKVTDVLSFPMLEQEEDGSLVIYDEDFVDDKVLLGDVVLSLEKAREQAEEYGHTPERELAFLMVHAVLHLLGYDHERGQGEEKEMFEKQEQLLHELGFIR